jgi:transcriptional regulator with XRE-family HTH domain
MKKGDTSKAYARQDKPAQDKNLKTQLYSNVRNAAQSAFGRKLSERIRAGGLTQAEFARMIQTKPQNVSRWISGIAMPRASALDKIGIVLNVSVCDLLVEFTSDNLNKDLTTISKQHIQNVVTGLIKIVNQQESDIKALKQALRELQRLL